MARATASRSPAPRSARSSCEEGDLEEQVAELVEQLGVVTDERRVGDLVGLLDRVRHDRALALDAVPGAVAPQTRGQLRAARAAPRRAPSQVVVWLGVVIVAHGSGDGVYPAW